MEYVYAAMLLHKAGKKIDEPSLKKVLEAAGITPDETRIKALVATLQGVDIDKAIETAQAVQVSTAAPKEEKKEEKKVEEEKKSEEQAAAGLGALFG